MKDILVSCQYGQKLYPSDYDVKIPQYLNTNINNVSTTIKNALNNRLINIIDIITNGFTAVDTYTAVEGSTYKIQFSNGGTNYYTDPRCKHKRRYTQAEKLVLLVKLLEQEDVL